MLRKEVPSWKFPLSQIPIVYVLTVVGCSPSGSALRGVFIGDDVECFHRAAELSLAVNFEMLDRPIRKAVVYLDPHEYQSTWLGDGRWNLVLRLQMKVAAGD